MLTIKNYSLLFLIIFALLISCAKQPSAIVDNNPFDPDGVNWNPPTVVAMYDTSVNINDTLLITALGTDNGTVSKYTWAKNGIVFADTTTSGIIKIAYADSGMKIVLVKGVDNQNVASLPDTCVVKVTLDLPVVVAMRNTNVNINDSITITALGTDNGRIVKYIWAKTGAAYADTTTLGLLKVAYADSGIKNILVKAIDDDGLASLPDTCVVKVTLDLPVVVAMRDTNVNLNDSITITASGSDNGRVVSYIWAKTGGFYNDTTTIGCLRVAYSDGGLKYVYVKAINDDGTVSLRDTCIVRVTVDPPAVVAMRDTSVNINDSITITAMGTDDGRVVSYIWAKAGGSYNDTTTTGSLKVAYADSGKKYFYVKVIDDDGVVSLRDTCIIKVTLNAPLITRVRDTIISQTAAVTITVVAIDTNKGGSIRKYYWGHGVNGWGDSTDAPFYAFAKPSGGIDTIVWGAKDDDGIMTKDTFNIVFNRRPTDGRVTVPASNTGWLDYNWLTAKGSIPFTMYGNDLDLPKDTLTYKLSLGTTAGSLTQVYTGRLAQYTFANVSSGDTVYWGLLVRDKYGDSAIFSGMVIIPLPPPPAGMKRIVAGTFFMGESDISAATPVHNVTVSSFWMDSIEVTQNAYETRMSTTYKGYSSPLWNASYGLGPNIPAYSVTWCDAVLYCNARSKREGKDTVYSYGSITGTPGNGCVLNELSIDFAKKGYRLPTEAEWEYACRAGTTTPYYWGNSNYNNYCHAYWYQQIQIFPVASKLPNAWGLYDMSGNVWEWCNDWYESYSAGAVTDPIGAVSGTTRVVRGGSSSDDVTWTRSAFRYSAFPNYVYSYYGFRVVLPAQ